MSEIPRSKLADVAEIRTSNVDKLTKTNERRVLLCNYMDVYSNEYITRDMPFMVATADPAEIERFRVERGDVIITKDSETPDDIGVPAVVVDEVEDLVCGYHLSLIRPDTTKIDPIYLSKAIASTAVQRYFANRATGSTRYGLASGTVAATPIPCPPLSAQSKIGKILKILDDHIAATRTLIAKYRLLKSGLMHDLFTRGLTPDGQLRESYEIAPGLYRDSSLGICPKQWIDYRIGDELDIQLGKMLSKVSKTGRYTAKYLGNKAVQWNHIDTKNVEQMDFLPHERDKYALQTGDLLVCEGGEIGRTALWRDDIENCYYQKAIHRLRPKSNSINTRYMLRLMFYAKSIGLLNDFTSQSSIAHLTREKLATITLPFPVPGEQEAIAVRFDAIDGKINSEQVYLQKIIHLKRGLMEDLLTGRVEVKV